MAKHQHICCVGDHVQICHGVQVKEVLQKYLDDEDDLKDLHLSAR